MAELLSIAQVVYDQVYPNASIQTSVKVEHFIEVAKDRYAYELWLQMKIDQQTEGDWEIPSSLWREVTLPIENDEADLSSLKIFRSFRGDAWLKVNAFDCECEYMRQSLNLSRILCDDEYLGNAKPYVVVGTKIKFPKGTHATELPIVYASNGSGLDDRIQVDDAIGALVGDYLWKRFTGRLPEDKTENSNTNQ